MIAPTDAAHLYRGIALAWSQFCALLCKRWTYTRRNPLVTLCQLFVPALCALLALLVYREIYASQQGGEPSSLQLDLARIYQSMTLRQQKLVLPWAVAGDAGPASKRVAEAFLGQYDRALLEPLQIGSGVRAFSVRCDFLFFPTRFALLARTCGRRSVRGWRLCCGGRSAHQ